MSSQRNVFWKSENDLNSFFFRFFLEQRILVISSLNYVRVRKRVNLTLLFVRSYPRGNDCCKITKAKGCSFGMVLFWPYIVRSKMCLKHWKSLALNTNKGLESFSAKFEHLFYPPHNYRIWSNSFITVTIIVRWIKQVLKFSWKRF